MELNYKTFGQGDPVIILHGLFGMLDNWQSIAKKLSENYTVYTVDQRNHGRSPHTDVMDYQAMSEDLKYFMESHWIYHAHLIGHSMGGKTVMQFAMDYPDMIDQLIVVDIAPKAYPGGHQEIFDALFALDLSKVDNRQEAEAFLEGRIEQVGVRQFLLKNMSRKKEGAYEWKMNLPVIHEHYQEILSATKTEPPFDGPTLFIRGERSNYIQDDDIATIKKTFPKAEIKTIPGAGHWVHAEAPVAFLKATHNFLASTTA